MSDFRKLINELKMKKSSLVSTTINLLLFIGLFSCKNLKKEKADVIIHNATIYTVNDNFDIASAMVINHDSIVAIGAEHEILNKFQAKKVIDMRQQFVYPGFIDAHCHFVHFGLGLEKVNLIGTKSWEECLQRIIKYNGTHQYDWITGRGWDQNDWELNEFPTNEKLNELFPNKPVFIRRIDGHAGIANKKALELAGIDISTKIKGGEIVTKNNELTGVLIDNAMNFIDSVIPAPSVNQIKNGILQAQKKCLQVGLTTVNDAGLNKSVIEILSSMHKDSSLLMDVYAMITDNKENFDHYLKSGPVVNKKLSVRSFKFYADGALGSRGAALKKEYHDQHNHRGFILKPAEYYEKRARQLLKKGFQMNTHCIGDSANKLILNIYGKFLKETNDLRWKIEHAQVIDSKDFHLFRKYTIIPSVQPTHATSDMYWAEDRLGKSRIKHAYAYKGLLEQNGIIALGTDFPIEGISPLKTYYAAVFRQDSLDFPQNGFNIENSLSPKEALKGITIYNAISNFEENSKGSLEMGKKASFTVLNRDLIATPKELFKHINVNETWIDGKKAYSID